MKTAFVFGGQGTQHPGMGYNFYEAYEECRNLFDLAGRVFGFNMAELCFDARQEQLNEVLYSQSSVLTVDLCAFLAAKIQGVSCDATAGYSLGEYAALAAAGVVTFEQAFELVKWRAQSMQRRLPPGKFGMLAIKRLGPEEVKEICKQIKNGFVAVSNFNSHRQLTVSGNEAGIAEFQSIVRQKRGVAVPIQVSGPFHSELMKPSAELFEEKIRGVSYQPPVCPVFMNVTGEKLDDTQQLPELLVQQMYSPVQWITTIENMSKYGINQFLECAPRSVLCRFIDDILPGDVLEENRFIKLA